MNVRQLLYDLSYEGEVEGVRQTYYVFQGKEHFLVLSFKRDDPTAGNLNIIDSEAVAYAATKLQGTKGITSKQLFEESKRTKHFKDRFVALNVLYVLAATKKATVDRRFKPGALVFNVA